MIHSNLNSGSFVKTPTGMLLRYPFLPDYKAEMTALYGLIVHYYNEREGYAWPNVDTLALHYGKAVQTTSAHLTVLEKYGLISVRTVGGKKRFVPNPPKDEQELFASFPEALAEYQRRLKARDDERQRSAENMARLRQKTEATAEESVATPIIYHDPTTEREHDVSTWL
ncbi:helix-turn-helix domain-containing protein [Paenibacillus terrigena]|uniref:helix-turn-helix domain-containing protein n=1 Tax=Paenibacillus terrigena TaxID=369333 RepID=UPI0028D8F713|nr:helix-turn-helix domain-containing protein [Paenibacillus terrigena]